MIITRGFYIGAKEVTQAQYKSVMGAYYDCSPCNVDCALPEIPVMRIGWREANQFCQWLSAQEARTYRLPSEAEWEYACRSGTRTRFWFGDALDIPDDAIILLYCGHKYLAFLGCSRFPEAPVEKPNLFGLYNIHDSVSEWCGDWYAPYPGGLVIDPRGPETPTGKKVWRGDPWEFGNARSAARLPFEPIIMSHNSWACNPGLRVVLQVFPSPYPH